MASSTANRVRNLLKKHGLKGVNKPKRTPQHPKKSHIVLAKEGNKVKLIRYGQQGAKTAGKPKAGESDRMKKKRASFKARHRRNIKKGKMSAAYWANRSKWCLLFPILSLQAQSWVNVNFVSDQYPDENSWEILSDTNVVASGVAEEVLVTLPAGQYTFVAYDEFGDGICCQYGEGFFTLTNGCGLDIGVYDFASDQMEIPLNLLPCPPPVVGCMDEEASNYDPLAVIDDLCLYSVRFRLDLNGPHPEGIVTPEVNTSWHGWCGSCNQMQDLDGDGIWEVTLDFPLGDHLWKFSADDWAHQEMPAGVINSPCFLFDEWGFVNRPLNVEGSMTLPTFCWESCFPCGSIVGCTDSTATNYNPWANFNQGCNVVESANCDITQTEVSVTVIPDNYPAETSWGLVDLTLGGVISSINTGDLSEAPVGIPIVTNTCVSIGSQIQIIVMDSYGDGMNGSQWGGEDGKVIVEACGEEVWSLPSENINFGYSLEASFPAPVCQTIEDLVGCGDPDYLEYNPAATVFLDLLCETPVVYGCIDTAYYNYSPEANVEEQPDSCFYTLTLTDGVGDGWFGSWIGVKQGEWISPQYQMGPADGVEESFELYLPSDEEVELFFFSTPQSLFTVAQCGFMLEGPTGDTLIDVPQWNIIPFPYTYTATTYCGNLCEEYVYGCMDTTAQNYVALANTADSSCYYAAGCMQAGYLEYYTQGYEADYDDGSCLTFAVFGCTDSTSYNYNPEANVDNEGCIPVLLGCTNSLAYNYSFLANVDDGSCIPYIFGCTDPTAFNYDAEANSDDDSCIPVILGCLDTLALNYDPVANTDNGGCILPLGGCMDNGAYNYNPEANVGVPEECLYDAGCATGAGVPYWLNDSCYGWVIEVDPYCCEAEWDGGCIGLYDYCQQGWPTGVTELSEEVTIRPTIVEHKFYVDSPYPFVLTVFDATGREVLRSSRATQDASQWPVGTYHLIVVSDNRMFKQTIVKL